MGALESLADGLHLLEELLAEPVLEPRGDGKDWTEVDSRVHLVQSTLRQKVLAHLPAALDEAGNDRTIVAERAAFVLGQTAALLIAAGEAMDGTGALSRAIEIVPEGALRAELASGRQDPAAFRRLHHARWLQGHGRAGEARAVLRGFAQSTHEEPLRNAARIVLDAPRPIDKAPALFRINGIGVGLYGERDAAPDGSYVATYCLSALWIPVLPLTAYRVHKDGSTYYFHTRERLGRIARVWQAAAAVGIVGWLAFLGIQSYLESPAWLSRSALKEARALERDGKAAEAMSRYAATAAGFPDRAEGRTAAENVLRMASASVKEPLRPEDVAVVSRVVVAFDRLPPAARGGAPAAYLTHRLDAWAGQLGQADSRHTRGALAVLDLASRVAEGTERTAVEARRTSLRLALADTLARGGRPVDALREYGQLQTTDSVQRASAVITSLGTDDSLWNEASEDITQWMARAERMPAQAEAVAATRTRLRAARAAVEAADKVVESGNETALRAAVATQPGNQELRVAAAHLLRGQGDSARCASLFQTVPAGRLTAEAQGLFGACLADTGDLSAADEVLTGLLEERLAPFQRARKAYSDAAGQLEEKLGDAADRGDLPADVKQALEAAAENDRRDIYDKWVAETLEKDVPLRALRESYLRHRAVVPASLALGSVKLRRAGEASGADKQMLLEGAERAFLSIREEAEGAPSFHLGLGQVLYRLGRPKEGEKELASVLDAKDPGLTMSVAQAYRELGLENRARAILEGLHASAPTTEWKQAAALDRATVFTDLDDEEKWLKRCDQRSALVRIRLVETRAARMMRDGKRAEADKAFAEAAAFYDRSAAHGSSSANNASIAFQGRYNATGDLNHLRAAVLRMEAAARLSPDDPIVLGNLAAVLDDVTHLVVAQRFVRVRDLLLYGNEARQVLDAVRTEPLRTEVREALRREPTFVRQVEVTRQEQILAPQKRAPYLRQLRWLRADQDVAGLDALGRTVREVAGMEASDDAERKAWRSGAKDATGRVWAVAAVARSEERLRRVAAADAHTQAAAYLLHADDLETVAFYDPSPAAYERQVAAARKAMALWPEAGFESDLANALLKVAAYRAAQTDATVKAALDRDRRTYRMARVLTRAVEGPEGAAAARAIRSQPEMAEVIRLRKVTCARQATLMDWLLARLAGDAALESLAASVFSRPDVRLGLDVDVALDPNDEDDREDRALLQARQVAAR
jgi:hypothetical protein